MMPGFGGPHFSKEQLEALVVDAVLTFGLVVAAFRLSPVMLNGAGMIMSRMFPRLLK